MKSVFFSVYVFFKSPINMKSDFSPCAKSSNGKAYFLKKLEVYRQQLKVNSVIGVFSKVFLIDCTSLGMLINRIH